VEGGGWRVVLSPNKILKNIFLKKKIYFSIKIQKQPSNPPHPPQPSTTP